MKIISRYGSIKYKIDTIRSNYQTHGHFGPSRGGTDGRGFWRTKHITILNYIIIHQTHYEKSDWSRTFNQFTIACEFDMINAISAADIAFIMSSSSSAWLLSPLECSPMKQNG